LIIRPKNIENAKLRPIENNAVSIVSKSLRPMILARKKPGRNKIKTIPTSSLAMGTSRKTAADADKRNAKVISKSRIGINPKLD